MNLTNNNPYRILGILAGTKASEQSRQIKRLKQFIEAEQEPDADFSFPVLGNFSRTLESVIDAEQKINLDSDKINSALFWFYNGNAITDEPAFDFLNDGNIDEAKSIWLKLINMSHINERNASAFHNLSTLLLYNDSSNELDFEQGIVLKLQLLESEFFKNIVEITTDITYKATKNEVQLSFLNQLKAEVEKGNKKSLDHFINILNKQTFSAKEDFFKSFIEKPIEEIEKKIAETITKRKADKTKSADFGSELFEATQKELSQIKEVLGVSNPKFITISDKLANEILQCSFIAFNHFQNTETEIGETVFELINKAKSIAIGSIIKDRIKENLPNIEAYIKRKPERVRNLQIGDYVNSINLILKEFNSINSFINNISIDKKTSANNLNLSLLFQNGKFTFTDEYINKIDILFSSLVKINLVVGKKDEFYIKLCSDISDVIASNIVTVLNHSDGEIFSALDITDKLDLLPGNSNLRLINSRKTSDTQLSYYLKVRESLMEITISRGWFHRSPFMKANSKYLEELSFLEKEKNKVFYQKNIDDANLALNNLKKWTLFRNKSQRESQIKEKEEEIKKLLFDSINDKEIAIKKQEEKVKEAEIIKNRIYNESQLYK
jgi:hypothetical protein